MPYKIKALAGETYRPSNGTEGMMFEEQHCEQCRFRDTEGQCPIILAAFVNEIDEPLYPKQYWVHDSEGCPECAAFYAKEPEISEDDPRDDR